MNDINRYGLLDKILSTQDLDELFSQVPIQETLYEESITHAKKALSVYAAAFAAWQSQRIAPSPSMVRREAVSIEHDLHKAADALANMSYDLRHSNLPFEPSLLIGEMGEMREHMGLFVSPRERFRGKSPHFQELWNLAGDAFELPFGKEDRERKDFTVSLFGMVADRCTLLSNHAETMKQLHSPDVKHREEQYKLYSRDPKAVIAGALLKMSRELLLYIGYEGVHDSVIAAQVVHIPSLYTHDLVSRGGGNVRYLTLKGRRVAYHLKTMQRAAREIEEVSLTNSEKP